MAKQGRIAEKFFIIRNTWRVWTRRIDERRQERKFRELEVRKLRKLFEGELSATPMLPPCSRSVLTSASAWLQRSRQEVQRKQAEQIIQRGLIRVRNIVSFHSVVADGV